jgi:hypothetical protein
VSEGDRYRVVNSGAVAEQFRQLADEARTHGRLTGFKQAARWIMEELARTPEEFGESWFVRPGSALTFRRGFARPLYVEYAFDTANRIVYLRRFVFERRV